MGKKSPDAPDVIGAAKEEGLQERASALETTIANRPNQYNPWGSTEWSWQETTNPITGEPMFTYGQTETLAPLLQQSLDAQQAVQAGRSELAEAGMARVWDEYQNPFDFDQYGDPIGMRDVGPVGRFDYQGPGVEQFAADPNAFRQQAEDAAYGRATSRLDPQFQAQQSQLEISLRNKGLSPGDQAYDAAMANFNRGRTDAYEQARMGATLEGRQEAQQMYQQALGGYQANLGAQQQAFQQAMGGQQFDLAAQGQDFGQATQQQAIANQLRRQQQEEDLFARGYDLQEVNALLAGQQIEGGPPSSGAASTTGAEQGK
jgi:hypothetical protein